MPLAHLQIGFLQDFRGCFAHDDDDTFLDPLPPFLRFLLFRQKVRFGPLAQVHDLDLLQLLDDRPRHRVAGSCPIKLFLGMMS